MGLKPKPHTDSTVRAQPLGHLFIHFPIVQRRFPGDGMYATRWVDETNPELVRTEWEANWFAAAFLMPEAVFRNIFEISQGSIELTSIQFGVSAKAASIRAKTLGLSPGTDQPF
ncbi:MAG: ImmA/IrrE family metallo-endopeptidase [Sphingomonas sp.]|nr:MAG: ImmA/IrrE family metallo-endopeptidase [Sphingomonas sp.]